MISFFLIQKPFKLPDIKVLQLQHRPIPLLSDSRALPPCLPPSGRGIGVDTVVRTSWRPSPRASFYLLSLPVRSVLPDKPVPLASVTSFEETRLWCNSPIQISSLEDYCCCARVEGGRKRKEEKLSVQSDRFLLNQCGTVRLRHSLSR